MLVKRGKNLISLEKYRAIFTFPVIEYYKKTGLDLSVDTFEELSKEFISDYETNKMSCDLFLEAEEILKYFNSKNLTQSILSAYSQNTLEEIINSFNLNKYFIKLVGLDNIYAASKIDNGIRWINDLGLDRSKVLMVGDSVHDYEVAKELGIQSVLIANGHQAIELLQNCDCTVLNNISELKRIIEF